MLVDNDTSAEMLAAETFGVEEGHVGFGRRRVCLCLAMVGRLGCGVYVKVLLHNC